MTHVLLRVTGRRQYRGHIPGTEFETRYDASIERAVYRGDVTILAEVEPGLSKGAYALPPDWPPQAADTEPTRGAERRLSH